MLSNLRAQPEDKILALIQAYKDDPRAEKVDLGVGVYKNALGETPIMRSVKKAESLLWEKQTTKSYTGLAGDPEFSAAMADLVLGDAVAKDRVAAIATPGGTGAIRQALELIRLANPDATVWISDPTWPNHPSIIRFLGMKMVEYPYFDRQSCAVDFDAMLAALGNVKRGDVVLLHGCCHNPTGANLSQEQWKAVTALLAQRGAVPFIDIAYQGFGEGLEQDAAGLRHLVAHVPEALVAASCSKNFGVYRERAGVLSAISETAAERPVVQGNLSFLNRQNYSFPPDHGARLVTMVLQDPALKADWQAELEDVRLGMIRLRTQLADELRQRTNSDRFDFIGQHRGMFSLIGATPAQVEEMRAKFGIYMVGDSRMNIAGLNETSVPILAEAIAKTCI